MSKRDWIPNIMTSETKKRELRVRHFGFPAYNHCA